MRKITVIIALFLAAIQIVSAQKVGLVLSGGGAKGAAHIGVIKALEENNIPIDYITGTSLSWSFSHCSFSLKVFGFFKSGQYPIGCLNWIFIYSSSGTQLSRPRLPSIENRRSGCCFIYFIVSIFMHCLRQKNIFYRLS